MGGNILKDLVRLLSWKYLLGRPLRIGGRALHLLGLVFFILSFYAAARPAPPLGVGWLILIGLFSLGSAFLGRRLFLTGKRMTVPPQYDKRDPVLYLRSFDDDEVAARVVKGSTLMPGESLLSTFGLTLSVTTEEEIIAKQLKRVGPCIAVGRPDEQLPPLGMHRMYFDDDHWQDGVRELMKRAGVVVMRAGLTESFLWELKTAVELVSPKKLLIILPFETGSYQSASRTSETYTKFRAAANNILPKQLSVFSEEGMPGTSLSGIVSFRADWTPKTLGLFAVGRTLNESFESISKRYAVYGII